MVSISKIIPPERVIAKLEARNKADVISELANHVADRVSAVDAEELAKVLAEREELSSTAIGNGVAIPHGKLNGLDSLIACLARSQTGVDFDAVDDEPTFLFFLLVAPRKSTGDHLKTLARISRLFRNPNFRNELMQAPSAQDMHDIIVAHEKKK